jgi:hypothetical protein
MKITILKGEATSFRVLSISPRNPIIDFKPEQFAVEQKLEHPQMVFLVQIETDGFELEPEGRVQPGVWYETFGDQVTVMRWLDGVRAGLALLGFHNFKYEMP